MAYFDHVGPTGMVSSRFRSGLLGGCSFSRFLGCRHLESIQRLIEKKVVDTPTANLLMWKEEASVDLEGEVVVV